MEKDERGLEMEVEVEVEVEVDDGDVVAMGMEVEKTWAETTEEVQKQMQALSSCGTVAGVADAAMVPRTNALLQDSMGKLRTLLLRYEMIAQQYPSDEGVEAGMKTLQEWKDQFQALRMSARNANVLAKRNIDQAAMNEREELLSGGQDANIRRRQLQTQAGLSSAAEGITDGLRRTRQMMVQEVERNAATLTALDQSNKTLKMATTEYKGQRSILGITRSKLTTMQRQDLIDRALVIFFVFIFLMVCFYITLRRLPFLKHTKTAPVLPVYQTPVKMPPPPAPVPEVSSQQFSSGGSEQLGFHKSLYTAKSVPPYHEHQDAHSNIPTARSAPEVVFRSEDPTCNPTYHEEL